MSLAAFQQLLGDLSEKGCYLTCEELTEIEQLPFWKCITRGAMALVNRSFSADTPEFGSSAESSLPGWPKRGSQQERDPQQVERRLAEDGV